MPNCKTHFEQVPLTVVKKIVEEQDQNETTEEDQRINKEKYKKVRSRAERQSITLSLTTAQREL